MNKQNKEKTNKDKNIKIKNLKNYEIEKYLDEMFDIISTNMASIIDTGNSKEEDYKLWKNAMIDEMKDKSKRWIGAFIDNKLIGYFLYKVNKNTVNLDEIQIIKNHQGDKCTFTKLFKSLLDDKNIKEDFIITTYVNKNNKKSQGIVNKFGFKIYENRQNGYKYINSFSKLKEEINKYVIK